MYKPLLPCLTIGKSDIHGLGIFATEPIYIGRDLGIAHISLPSFPQGYCRTPLGGFYNHSEEPNCTLISGHELFQIDPEINSSTLFLVVKRLFAIKNIERGEEITCIYTLYQMGENKNGQ